MRILIYVHRFGRNLVGGAVVHLWNLAEQMARLGCQVDVATILQTEPQAVGHVGLRWGSPRPSGLEEAEVEGAEHPIRIFRFPARHLWRPLRALDARRLQRHWEEEELAMEPTEPLPTPFASKAPLLLTGWHPPELAEDDKLTRWTMRRAAVQIPPTQHASLHIEGTVPRQTTVRFERLGASRVVYQGKGRYQITIRLVDHPKQTLGILRVEPVAHPWRDTRTLGLQVSQLLFASHGKIRLAPFHVDHHSLRTHDKAELIRSYSQRAEKRPKSYDRIFDRLRGPVSPRMEQFLKRNAGNYDWVIAGILPFATLPSAARVRRRTPFRLAALPLFHVDDATYYWQHYLDALREADVCLANAWSTNKTFFPAIGAKSFLAGAGVDEKLFRKDTIDGARFRERFGIEADERMVLSVGRKTGAKLYRTLAKAIHNIQHRVRCRLILVGPDEDRRTISYPSCQYLGTLSQDDLLDAYDACDLFCLMSESESFGITFVEAWMREKPVIGNSACAPIANLVRDGENGLLVTTREELEEALVDLLRDPEKRRALGKAGFEEAMRTHTWSVVARRVLDHLPDADHPAES